MLNVNKVEIQFSNNEVQAKRNCVLNFNFNFATEKNIYSLTHYV